MLERSRTLEDLWDYCDDLHAQHFPESNLRPVMGGGEVAKPRYMFVFINPTYRNITSRPNWKGLRAPWVGTKYIWEIFHRAGHFDRDLLEEIRDKKTWDTDFASKVYEHLKDRGFYFTNLVKWTGEDAGLPDKKKINLFLPILEREVELVEPVSIVTFGLIPFKALTSKRVKLGDYYDDVMRRQKIIPQKMLVGNHSTSIIPCFFPVGRGDPKRAVDVLKLL
jgi:DNA polymerase